jgi:hypothetical protein
MNAFFEPTTTGGHTMDLGKYYHAPEKTTQAQAPNTSQFNLFLIDIKFLRLNFDRNFLTYKAKICKKCMK